MSRYNRHIILSEIGQEGQDKISNAKVLVIGAGGLGCPVLQYLTAAGVGTIGVIDFDVVELSNLQRQVLFGTSSLGKNKAIAAKERLQDLNNDILITAYPEPLTYQNAIALFHQYDIIVDGSDNFETRYLVNDACIITNKPLVFGAIYKFEGQVSVFNYKNGPSYRCLFPSPPQKDAVPNCTDIGVLGVLPGIIGTMQANEVLKIILGIGNVLSGKLLCYNALNHKTSTLKINRNETSIQSVLNKQDSFENKQINIDCEIEVIEISISEMISEKNVQFIDVREIHEQPKVDHLKVTYIPLSELETSLHKIDLSKKKALFCKSGMRSKHAIKILQELNINNCFSIPQGASEINNYLKEHSKVNTEDFHLRGNEKI
ncbi:dinucleotide-utilizing protein [Algibacter marinivivus]|uniref:Molybdopterin-synthase adenylyltransferase n=1 Tax=Algibacter marinivivus TaxID=2100723 RepID=A0A2U2X2L9_9FLAO|nr:molybdopterin-synthase adenylyltransferase MoeB [Algibacter marinivivus]PWH81994.1 dinucleotide-utilizing protein [Algibacter marinivivus]